MKMIQTIRNILNHRKQPKIVLKTGMVVTFSERNKHSSGVPSAYGGMTGTIKNIYRDGSFDLNCGGCWLIISKTGSINATTIFSTKQKFIWLEFEGHQFKYKFKEHEYSKD